MNVHTNKMRCVISIIRKRILALRAISRTRARRGGETLDRNRARWKETRISRTKHTRERLHALGRANLPGTLPRSKRTRITSIFVAT